MFFLLCYLQSPYSSDSEAKDKGKRHSYTKDEKRNGYCKFMDLMNRKSKSAILEEWSLLSEDTKQRTQAYKHYMKRYRVDLVSQMAARIERYFVCFTFVVFAFWSVSLVSREACLHVSLLQKKKKKKI